MTNWARLFLLLVGLAVLTATGCDSAPSTKPSVTEKVGTTVPKPD